MKQIKTSVLIALLLVSSIFAKVSTFETGKTPSNIITVKKSGGDHIDLQSALNDSRLAPGWAIRIYPGTYYLPRVAVKDLLRGTESNPIWIGGVPGEEKPIIHAHNGNEIINLSRPQYVILHDMDLSQPVHHCVHIQDGGDRNDMNACKYIVIRDCKIHDVGTGSTDNCIKLSGVNNFYVFDNELYNAANYAASGGVNTTAIDMVGCHYGIIADNSIYNISGQGLKVKGGSFNIEITRNRFKDAGMQAIALGFDTGSEYYRPILKSSGNYEAYNVTVSANLIEKSNRPFFLSGVTNCYIVNNTIINPEKWEGSNRAHLINIVSSESSAEFVGCHDNHFINNCFYYEFSQIGIDGYRPQIESDNSPKTKINTFTFSNNLWYAWDAPASSKPLNYFSASTNNEKYINPEFKSSTDFRPIDYSSPLSKSGYISNKVTTDINNVSFTNPPNIGTYATVTSNDNGDITPPIDDDNDSPSNETKLIFKDGWSGQIWWGSLEKSYDGNTSTYLSNGCDPQKWRFALWRDEVASINKIRIYQKQSNKIRISVEDKKVWEGYVSANSWKEITFPATSGKWVNFEKTEGSSCWDIGEIEIYDDANSNTDTPSDNDDISNNESVKLTDFVDGWSGQVSWGSLGYAHDGTTNTSLYNGCDPNKWRFALWRSKSAAINKVRVYQKESNTLRVAVESKVVWEGAVPANSWKEISFNATHGQWVEFTKTSGSNCWNISEVEIWADPSLAKPKNESNLEELTLTEGIKVFPNPFNPTTSISYNLNRRMNVNLKVINAKGIVVKQLVTTISNRGSYNTTWNGKNNIGNSVASGSYFLMLRTGNKVFTKKIILLK